MKRVFLGLFLSLALVMIGHVVDASEKVMTFAEPVDIESIDPHQSQGSLAMKGVGPFYDPLVYYEGQTSTLIPWLAESWVVSEDGKVIDFHIRKGVKFHNGKEMTAEDVYYTFDRLLSTKLKGPANQLAKRIEKIELVAPYIFRMVLQKKSPVIFAQITTPWYGIMSKEYVESHKTSDDPWALKWMSNHECGTGPYQLVSWAPNERIIMTRSKDYWGSPPKTDKWNILIIKDPTTIEMMLKKGDIDMSCGLTSDQYVNLKEAEGVKVKAYPSYYICYMNINCKEKPLSDPRVRKALNYAIKHDEIIQFVEQGNAIRLRTILPEGIWGRPKDYVTYEYNPQKAKELLKEAGYPNGFSTTLMFSVERYGNFETLATYIQSYLSDVGIKAELKKVAWSIQLSEMKAAKHEIALNTWSPYYPDPAEFTPYFYNSEYYKMGSWNFSFWDNDETTELCKEAEQIMDQGKRAELYARVEQIGTENAVYVFLYQMSNMMAMRENVKGDIFHPTLIHKQFATEYKD